MNRWIETIKKFAEFYNKHPDLIDKSIERDRAIKEIIEMDEEKEIEDLKDTIEAMREENEHKSFWNSKHPKKDVKYRRPIYVSEGNWETHYISVVDFIMPHDCRIKNRVSNLKVEDPLKINEIVPKIYAEAKKNYNYEYDSKSLGMSEFWKFPPETMAGDGDCEDWAHLIASFLIGAGVSSWRVRVTYGYINKGDYGHSTVYVLDDDMETWRHLNSTSPEYYHDNLSDYPEFGDESDDIGIDPERVWGSFNDKNAWMELENKKTEKGFKESELSDKITTGDTSGR